MTEITKDWKALAITLAETTDMSWRQIARYLDKSKSSVSDVLRVHFKGYRKPEKLMVTETVTHRVGDIEHTVTTQTPVFNKHGVDMTRLQQGSDKVKKLVKTYRESKEDNSRILFISDMHIPYHHKDTLKFLAELKEKYKPTRVICLGDELDSHGLSFHDSDPDLYSAGDELQKALPVIAELYKMFPKMDLVDSNHGSLQYRRAKAHGIPRHFMKGYNEVLQVGGGWKWHNDLTIKLPNGQGLYVCHGKSSKGITLSRNMSMNCVQGHYHSAFNVEYWSNPNNLFWSMQAGCLIDDKSLAMAYNKLTLARPIIGTGLVIDGVPILETMNMESK